ncbi:MAG: BLUF domain-containing protein [Phyllobacteriaceae bacterium]|nr:BLUF domain-containing protein [Phyllobacteriaceae bacterium]
MGLVQLIYSSRPFGFDLSVLDGILLVARINNARNNVTGALICRADLYLQMLEGPEDAVQKTYASIKRDDRHMEITERVKRPITQRLFPHWAMLDDPAEGWLWTPDQVNQGAIDAAGTAQIINVFTRVRSMAGRPAAANING